MVKDEIKMAIDELMNHCGLSKGYRVRKLKSHVDNRDPNVSLKGLDMSFKLDGSYAPEKHLNVNLDYKVITAEMEALQEMIDEYEKQHPEAAKECEEEINRRIKLRTHGGK